MASGAFIVGIDLGTTNSSVAVVLDGAPRIIPVDGGDLVPSVVAMASDGSLLVGNVARNQAMLYPERTVRSVKRKMGKDEDLWLGDESFSPVEISAAILRRLKAGAEDYLQQKIERAVITVPAYFSDRQRTATREAGEVAGFVVERILNEPTAAALCYGSRENEIEENQDRAIMVYDLGGGTFDVSIVRRSGELTEVLASHGDTALGGDDFDALLTAHIKAEFESRQSVSLAGDLRAEARLRHACESAKIALSTESYVRVTEEHLAIRDGVGLHLDEEVSRHSYEALIRPFVERTRDSVQTALHEAGLLARDLDEVILVGGSTRTPMISEMLRQQLSLPPRMDVNPEKAVALGAALIAARAAGETTGQILVDVTPFTFGTSYVGLLNDRPHEACFKGVIKRNTPLPTRQTEVFYTMVDGQPAVDVEILQGEAEDARDNLMIGHFLIEGLDEEAPAGSPILFDFKLNLDGILEVEVTERHTGLTKGVIIDNAFRKLSVEELHSARNRIRNLLGCEDIDDRDDSKFAEVEEDEDENASASGLPRPPPELNPTQRTSWAKAVSLVEKAIRMTPELADVDRSEVQDINENLMSALKAADFGAIEEISNELADVLFYLE